MPEATEKEMKKLPLKIGDRVINKIYLEKTRKKEFGTIKNIWFGEKWGGWYNTKPNEFSYYVIWDDGAFNYYTKNQIIKTRKRKRK